MADKDQDVDSQRDSSPSQEEPVAELAGRSKRARQEHSDLAAEAEDDAEAEGEEDDAPGEEEEDDEEAERAARRRARRRKARLKAERKKSKEPPIPKTEAEINAPDRHTRIMLWSVVAVTLVLWGFARTACNFNPPQTDKARLVGPDIMSREPKWAATEFELRLRDRNFSVAEELAAESVKPSIAQAKQACGASCEPLPRGKVLCQGAVLSRQDPAAQVRVECRVENQPVSYSLVELVREKAVWKVVSTKPTTAEAPISPSKEPEPAPAAGDAGAVESP